MTLYLFAGPNGSGKSTIIANYIREYHLENVEYVCPDIYASELFAGIDDIYERYTRAMSFAEHKREKLLRNRQPLIMETVLSRADKLEFVERAKALGYRIVSVFVSTLRLTSILNESRNAFRRAGTMSRKKNCVRVMSGR